MFYGDNRDDFLPPSEKEIAEQNRYLKNSWENFQLAADYIACEFNQSSVVEKIVLFGSVAAPLKKEVPRFHDYRRHGIEVWHECSDLDLAVWLNDLSNLNILRKKCSHAVNQLLKDKNIGVASHQVDVFFLMQKRISMWGAYVVIKYAQEKKGKPAGLRAAVNQNILNK